MLPVRRTPVVMLFVAILVSACGGGGGNGGAKTLRLEAAFDRSGEIYGDGTWSILPDAGGGLETGDSNSGVLVRGVVSILLAPIPDGATIESAVLVLQGFPPSGNPYADFGDLILDHIDVGAALGFEDFSGGDLFVSYRTVPVFSPVPGTSTSVSIDVRTVLATDVGLGELTSSFRFRFAGAPSLDGEADRVTIVANPADPTVLPHVILTYR